MDRLKASSFRHDSEKSDAVKAEVLVDCQKDLFDNFIPVEADFRGRKIQVKLADDLQFGIEFLLASEMSSVQSAQMDAGGKQVGAKFIGARKGKIIKFCNPLYLPVHGGQQGMHVEVGERQDPFDIRFQRRLGNNLYRADPLGPGDEVGQGNNGA